MLDGDDEAVAVERLESDVDGDAGSESGVLLHREAAGERVVLGHLKLTHLGHQKLTHPA